MNASVIVNWALRNNFVALDDQRFRCSRDDKSLRMEIKRQSVVFIIEPFGKQPRILSRQFKELRIGKVTGGIEGLDNLLA
jgi:hypothetical protein